MNIYALGETTFDILFKDNRPIDSKVGGSVLNTAVSLGRLGVPVKMVAACGTDDIGSLTCRFLTENNIDASLLTVYKGTSRVALAFLDVRNDAHYTFYNGQNYDNKSLNFPREAKNGLVLFGSSFGIKSEIRQELREYLKRVHLNNNIVYYDPNIRQPQLNGNKNAKDWIIENIKLSDIIKGSNDDFLLLFGTDIAQETYKKIKSINPNAILISTANKDGVDIFTPTFNEHYHVPQINPISTIGAGDTFSAGIIYGLHLADVNKISLHFLHKDKWDKAVEYAIKFSTEVCLSYENYIAITE